MREGELGTWRGKRGQEFRMLNLAIVQFEERTFQKRQIIPEPGERGRAL